MEIDACPNALQGALAALTALEPRDCVPLPPRRIPLPDGRECLVQWQPGDGPGRWRLSLTERSARPDDRSSPVSIFSARIDLSARKASVEWENVASDDTGRNFAQWIESNLSRIVSEVVAAQVGARTPFLRRARAKGHAGVSLLDFVPHVVIVVALAAFVYMFGVIHVK